MTAQPVPAGRNAGAATVLTTHIIDALGQDITDGVLAEGARLTIEGLQQRFGVSRTVVRDCMRVLESMHLIVPKRRLGLVVQAPASWNVYDARVIRWRLNGPGRAGQFRSLTHLRRAVEPVAAALAAEHASSDQRLRLLDLGRDLRRLGENGDLEEFLAVDIEFHTLILESSGNEMFLALQGVIAEVLSGRTHQGLMPHHPKEHALRTHEQVAEAISSGHPTAAETGMASLLAEVRSAIE
ncbi:MULTISPECIES: FadR/GntR family transcriptional regulator [unclassified Arthrobacter]|uniref:FadR/GntR family transcriptional regulator n=1 Tax=unclassified Arthrobacter TaxID=235627 RepID=UPI0006F3A4B1|nr:FCD domain-containing protein [Arthrobacter sp. Leaf234]KQO03127.1 transcriptional regulator [Arthrobacter sp. Leaf234]